jgi:hypothetical protein
MDLSQSNILSNDVFGLRSDFLNKKPAGLKFGMKTNNNNSGFYAKKGEPMYMKEMDADEDGVVSFDEFKDYCQANGISPKEMTKMVQMANSYRTMQAQKKAEKSIEQSKSENKLETKEVESEAVYARRGDGKYDEAMDMNSDDKVSYKEYIEYCKEHSQPQEQESDTKVSESEDGEFKTTSTGKAINSYTQSETESAENFVDEEG